MEQKCVCVITGGGSGMGLAAAKFMSKDKIIVISGRTKTKLEKAVEYLKETGLEAYAHTCDTSDRISVHELAHFAVSLGKITNVINAAGLSPAMANGEQLLKVNALGTVYVNQEFSKLMDSGSVIVDVASTAAYALPGYLISYKIYGLAETNETQFIHKLLKKSNFIGNAYEKAGFAYALSKNFVVWYAQKCAFEYGKKGIRVVSVSPGPTTTEMGRLEEKTGSYLLKYAIEHRPGKPEELGYALATIADERNGYLAGVDVLCDGGCVNGEKRKNSLKRN